MEQPSHPPGMKLVFSNPEQQKQEASNRTDRYVNFLRRRATRKAELNEQILQYPDEKIDAERLSKTPDLFQFGNGFEGHPPTTFKDGEEPEFAPLSKEQMRILLAESLPQPMLAFILDRFTFDYEPVPEGHDGPPPGPVVRLVDGGKVAITFYRPSFFTQGVPPHLRESKRKEDKERAKNVTAFLDPAKVTLFMGKLIAKMIPQPPGWGVELPPNFQVTKEKTDKKKQRALSKQEQRIQKAIQLQRRWEDFVALAVAAPLEAQKVAGKSYEYLEGQFELFADANNELPALSRLAAASQNNELRFNDFQVCIDLRTDEEKQANKPISPELAFYERFITKLNRLTSNFGFIITYRKPTDPQRAALLAEDDKEIKGLLATDEKDRDNEFGDVMASPGNELDAKERNLARRYLLAASQAGEFQEWRIWAWLHKFSPTFKRTKGRHISEDDYQDLQLIYSESEKTGNRVGTGVLPFEATALTAAVDPSAKYYGRKVSIYTLKERSQYIKDVEKKVLARKDPRTLLNSNDKAFDLFKTADGSYIPLEARFSGDPATLNTASGNLVDILGKDGATEVGEWMGRYGIGPISPDAIALAKGMATYYHSTPEGQANRYMKPIAIDIVTRYAKQLTRPPEQELAALKSQSPTDVIKSNDFYRIGDRMREAQRTEGLILGTISSQIERTELPILEQAKDYLLTLIKKHGIYNSEDLFQLTHQYISTLIPENSLANRQQYFNILNFINQPAIQQSLAMLRETTKYQDAIRPTYANGFEKAGEEIQEKADKQGDLSAIIGDESILGNEDTLLERLQPYVQRKIIDAGQIKKLGEAPAPVAAADGTVPDPDLSIDDLTGQTVSKRKAYIIKAIAEADPKELQVSVFEAIGTAIDGPHRDGEGGLQKALFREDPAKPTYKARYLDWKNSAGRIFTISSLRQFDRDILAAATAADANATNPTTGQTGLDYLYNTIKKAQLALNYELYSLQPHKPVKIPGSNENEEDL